MNPPILPPVNNTAEPVMSPFCFTLKFVVDINLFSGSSVPPAAGEPLMKISVEDIESAFIANPPIWPLLAFILPVKKTFPLYNPKSGLEPTNPLDNPDKSPSLAFRSISYTPVPCLSMMSIYGVVVSFGFAFSLIYPVFCLPVDTNTCPGS